MVCARVCVCRNEDARYNKISFGKKTMNFFFFNTDYVVFNRIFGNEMVQVFNFEF